MILLSFAGTLTVYAADGVRIAVIDTGISSRAINKENLDTGKNYIFPGLYTEDTIGHGTSVAALIVGCQSAGVEGVCSEAILVPLVFAAEHNGSAVNGSISLIAKMIVDAVDVYGCQIINISAGALLDNNTLRDAVAYAEKKGVLIVASAGNEGNAYPFYPAAYSTVLAVGALNEAGTGPAYFSSYFQGVDLMAPGENVISADIDGRPVLVSGTSFSSPVVSGMAARLLLEDPTLTPYQIRQLLCSTATDIAAPGYDARTGWGIANLEAALQKLAEMKESPFPFLDVAEDAYYREAVVWALNRGITFGTKSDAFSPELSLTRAEVITFLWRASGCPEPRRIRNPFVDVSESDYFYKPVLWALEKGITEGTSATTFGPKQVCTEKEIITMLWRANGKPAAAGRSELAISIGDSYYTQAVAWADTYGFFAAARKEFTAHDPLVRANLVVYLHHNALVEQ